jgi:hypothetical protein
VGDHGIPSCSSQNLSALEWIDKRFVTLRQASGCIFRGTWKISAIPILLDNPVHGVASYPLLLHSQILKTGMGAISMKMKSRWIASLFVSLATLEASAPLHPAQPCDRQCMVAPKQNCLGWV